MDLFQGIDTLLKFNVIRWKLGLWEHWIQSKLKWSIPVRTGWHRTLSSALPSCSFTYCWVRAAKGEMEDLLSRSVRQIVYLDVPAWGDPRYVLPESLNLVHPDNFSVSKSVRACEWGSRLMLYLVLRSYHLFVVSGRSFNMQESLAGLIDFKKTLRHWTMQ